MSQSPLSRLRARVLGSKMTHLEQENQKLREQVYKQKAPAPKALPDETNDLARVRETVRESYREGTLMELAQELAVKKQLHDRFSREAMLEALRQVAREGTAAEDQMRQLLLPAFTAAQLPERFARGIEHRDIPSLEPLSSFRGQLTARTRRLQKGHALPEWTVDDKEKAYKLARSLDIAVPEVLATSVPLEQLTLAPGTVVKPADGAGGRGVYVLRAEDDILNVKTSEVLPSMEALRRELEQDLASGRVAEDSWSVEKVYYADKETKEPARDMKCYTFYGKTVLLLEITRSPETAYCWWTPEGEPIETGKYTGQLMDGDGPDLRALEAASRLGKAIPAPFCRFDFLQTTDGLLFGECTPKPGNYDQFDAATDRALGEAFLEAEEVLMHDLLNGERYIHWRNLL
ncbi:ATP-grasp fold amidoligase family protein [Alkalicoccus luteus]|uniref:ATP-grasp domain-containing protein n=1 Tax=Alkalicoccus luteus TaxID=1237094 RepID=A0A969TUT9_9BACI|nr:hypothetical protein [Alkalicoccus luteus]